MYKSLGLFITAFFLFSCGNNSGSDDLKIAYFPNSKVIKQSVEYKNNKKNGFLRLFYSDGKPKAIQKFINDTITDTSFLFHDNGVLSQYQIFDKGVKTGCWKKFNKKGMEFWNSCFKNGLLNGPAKEYSYNSLKPVLSFNFLNGAKNGRQETYHDNGKLKSVSYFNNGFICSGTEEWKKNGEKINNDFAISISEKNEVLLKNTLRLFVIPENIQPEDLAYEITPQDTGNNISTIRRLIREHNHFVLEYTIAQGGFVMETVHAAIFRKTLFGNTFVKKASFRVAANNFD